MKTMRLDLDQLAVESFEAAAAPVTALEMVAGTKMCSAIDACPTRLCETNVC